MRDLPFDREPANSAFSFLPRLHGKRTVRQFGKRKDDPPEIKLADKNNFTRDSLNGFIRYQKVKNVYRMTDRRMTLVRHPFTEDRDAACRVQKAEEIISGRYITYCAFEENRAVSEIMLLPQLNEGRLVIDSFHVSAEYRRQGIGRALFEAAKNEALKRGARALYASCRSAEETVSFCLAMGFRLSPDPIPACAEEEPFDLQTECPVPENASDSVKVNDK